MSCFDPFYSCTGHGQRQKSTGKYGHSSMHNSATALLSEDADLIGTSMIEPELDEAGDWASIDFDDNQWTDSELMDDGRPGRRRAADDQDPKPQDSEKQFKGTSLISLFEHSKAGDDTGCGWNPTTECETRDARAAPKG